ncbi:MAG: glycine--tRNA ligase subunit beta, partial [Selenomonadaceae bacterium]|nr:glycine--tRNA ligase subunit beta [Selenomonadaceae bacterium]
MSAKTLLLEIGTEEIPAHAMPGILDQLKALATTAFKDARIEVSTVKTLGTPRRLALIINGVAERQADVSEERKGPSIKIAFDAEGKPSKAAIGFARGQKVAPEDLVKRDGYVYAVVHQSGQPTDELLKAMLPKLICSLSFPNNMRWGDLDFKFIRPIRWIVALLDDEIIPFELANVK